MTMPMLSDSESDLQFHYMVLGLCIALTTAAQLCLKTGASRMAHRHLLHSAINPYTLIGYGLFVVNTICTVYVLQMVELKIVSTVVALSYAFVVIMARFLLKENLGTRKLFGCLLIVAGVVIFELG